MKNALLMMLILTVSKSVSASDYVAFYDAQFENTNMIIGANQEQSNEILVGAIMQMLWNYTCKESFDTLTDKMFDQMKNSMQFVNDGEALPITFEMVSDINSASLSVVYRF